jgi:hypothetical protein
MAATIIIGSAAATGATSAPGGRAESRSDTHSSRQNPAEKNPSPVDFPHCVLLHAKWLASLLAASRNRIERFSLDESLFLKMPQ